MCLATMIQVARGAVKEETTFWSSTNAYSVLIYRIAVSAVRPTVKSAPSATRVSSSTTLSVQSVLLSVCHARVRRYALLVLTVTLYLKTVHKEDVLNVNHLALNV